MTLFNSFAETAEHQSTVARCRNDGPADQLAARRACKAKLYRLRNIRRAAAKLYQTRRQSDRVPVSQYWMDRYTSGSLDSEIAELTRQHGFGRVHFPDGTMVDTRPLAFEDYVSSSIGVASPHAAIEHRTTWNI